MVSATHREDRSGSGPLHRAAAIAVSVLLTSCTVIGPTAQVEPGIDKSPTAFDADRRACMAATDQVLQPVANRLTGSGMTPQQVAANNQQIQDAYNERYAGCMAAAGNVPAQGAVPRARAPDGYPPVPGDTVAAAASPDGGLPRGWRLLELSYHAASGRPKDANDALWPREIANPPAGPGGALPIYSVSFADGPRIILLSIAGQGAEICDDGPNTASSTRDYAVCPGKLAVVEAGRISTRSTGLLCAEAINAGGVQPGAPGWQDPARWGTRARYDAAARIIEMMTMQNGRPQSGCGKTLAVR